MARRTLKASEKGIDRAKRALKRLGLTQKDLTIEPLIASWGTINGFFNGRPIDHTIFKEICHHLDLDWKEIYEPPIEEDEPIQASQPIQSSEDSLFLAVQQESIVILFRTSQLLRFAPLPKRSSEKSILSADGHLLITFCRSQQTIARSETSSKIPYS
ncbi:hypothetical protein ACQ4M3_30200 [Leptolyngbya sp. AN03gr2]|uniref:hypothetical protein n=1 Tax=unclassified Leptolyngbya TaxID=2650499 RepID=UPI003D314177